MTFIEPIELNERKQNTQSLGNESRTVSFSSTWLSVPTDITDGDSTQAASDNGLLEDQNPSKQRSSAASRIQRHSQYFSRLLKLHDFTAWFRESEGPRKYRGWRKAVVAAAIITAFVLVANIVLAIYAATRSNAGAGIGVLYKGNCGLVERWNTALHLLINILGTCLLSASSFTMQCLSSPTRSETDRAHAKRIPLEIGVPSVRNLSHMHWWKGFLWWALCLSTVPLHLFWNSTIFSTIGANSFDYLVVDESFLHGAAYLTPNVTDLASGVIAPYDITDPAIYLEGYRNGSYSKVLNPEQCLDTYMAMFVTGHRNFIAVTKPQSGMRMNPGSLFPTYQINASSEFPDYYLASLNYVTLSPMSYVEPLWNGSSVLGFQGSIQLQTLSGRAVSSDQWPCMGWINDFRHTPLPKCDLVHAKRMLKENGTWWLRPFDAPDIVDPISTQAYPIDYCLAESQNVETCQLQYVSYILITVICCNVVKLACMSATALYLWNRNEPIFATVGDAVSSFMERPDTTTAGWCLMDLSTSKVWRHCDHEDGKRHVPRKRIDIYERKPTIRLLQATSKTRWWATISFCTIYLFVGIILLRAAADTVEGSAGSFSAIWTEFGLGEVTNSNTLHQESSAKKSSLISSILLANCFQLVLSMTYFLFNSLWTAQCSAIEWTRYVVKRKPLRVTWPRGQQRSTYYLNLPYRYGVPLTVMLALLHFLISQSIFLARVQYYNPDGSESTQFISDAAFSPLGILITVCVALVLILTMVAHSFRKIDNRMPVHGNSSVVISALCHTSPSEYRNDQGLILEHPEQDMSERNIMWGVVTPATEIFRFKNEIPIVENEETLVDNENSIPSNSERANCSVGHCSFTAEEVNPPELGRIYR